MTTHNKIRVAFFVYPSAFQNVGGGEILLLKTKEYIEKEGVECKFFDMWNDKLEDFDILHVIGAVKCCLGLMQTAKNKGVRVVLDPVFFSTFERAICEAGDPKRKLEAIVRHLVKVIFPCFPSDRRKMMLLADAVIPNSRMEMKQLGRLFSIPKNKMHVVLNGVDPDFENGDEKLFLYKYKIKDFILSVGRIEPRKNQLNLIKAMKGYDLPLVIIGNPVSDYMSYYKECKNAGGDKVIFIDRLDHADPLLKSAYKACKCFVSQGWFETPGLAALESALSGSNIATTDKGCTKEYFMGFAEYFSPSDITGIRKAVEKSVLKPKSNDLKEHIKRNFLWSVVAKNNLKIYNDLLGQ